jgi:hypothetical protein
MEGRKDCRAAHAYVNPTTFATLKINARMVVGTEFRFSLTKAMIRSPTQRTGKAYKAICSSGGSDMGCAVPGLYGSLKTDYSTLTQNIL